MVTVLIALGVAVVVGGIAAVVPFIGPIGAIIPFVVALVGTYIFLIRNVNKALQGQMKGVQAALMQKNIDAALTLLESLRARYGKWVFFLSSQLDGQIGGIHFLKKDFEKARPYLERSFFRMWESRLMLAVLTSGQIGKGGGDLKKVDEILEKTSKFAGKQGLLWSTWAYLHWKAGNEKRAIDLLARGKQNLGDADPVLSQNLLALQNDKKMKMKGYGDAWYGLHLETHPMVMQAQRGNVKFARR